MSKTDFHKYFEAPVIEKRLRNLSLALVYLFGSQAEGLAGKLSDIDIGVVFADPKIAKGDTRKIYNELYDMFTEVFSAENIDIVFLERASLELRFDVIRHGKLLFEASSDFRITFEHKTAMLYLDFKPLAERFNKAVLERI